MTPLKYRTFNAALIVWKCVNNKFDTWDYEWNYFHIFNNNKSITPKGFHILNHGYRKDATHTLIEKPPWTKIDKYKFFEKKIININNSFNPKLENLITSECGFPMQENYLLELMRLIKYSLKNYIIKFKRNVLNKPLR